MKTQKFVLVLLRLVMAGIFLWAFFDKLLGLGFSTPSVNAWIHGGSPTTGFLTNAVSGPFAAFFHQLAGMPLVDWVFMAGLLFVGLTLLFNRYMVGGAIAGIGMMLLMYCALLFPATNPILDDHIVYALVLALLATNSRTKLISQ